MHAFARFTAPDGRIIVREIDDGRIGKDAGLNFGEGVWLMMIHGDEYVDGELRERITTNEIRLTVKASGLHDGEVWDIEIDSGTQIIAKAYEQADRAKSEADRAAGYAENVQADIEVTERLIRQTEGIAEQAGRDAELALQAAREVPAAVQGARDAAAGALTAKNHAELAAGRAESAAENALSVADEAYGGLKEALLRVEENKVGYSEVVNGQLLMYSDSTKSKLLATLDLPVGTSTDVQIDSTSITQDGVANIPYSHEGHGGIVWGYNYNPDYGVNIVNDSGRNGCLRINPATESRIDARTGKGMALTPVNLNYAVKAAFTDSNKVVLTDSEKAAACDTLGAADGREFELIEEFTTTEDGYFTRTAEPDGAPYNFDAIMIRIAQPTANGVGFRIRDKDRNHWIFYGGSGSTYKNAIYKCWKQHGLFISNVLSGNDFTGSNTIIGGTYESFGKTIGWVRLETVKANSNIKIYGVRAR